MDDEIMMKFDDARKDEERERFTLEKRQVLERLTEEYVAKIRALSPRSAVHFNLGVSNGGFEFKFTHMVDLVSDEQYRMRKLRGEWIK